MDRKKALPAIYWATFFYSLHYAVVLYIESSYLSTFFSAENVGLIFTGAALISVIIHFNIAPFLKRVGNYVFIISLVIAEVASLSLLALAPGKEVVVTAFIMHQVLLNLIFLSLTVFLETYSKNETTGGNRGLFLTILNLAVLIGALIGSRAIDGDSYKNVFIWSAVLVLPIIYLIGSKFKEFRDPHYDSTDVPKTLSRILSDKNLRSVFSIQFILEFFYGVMVIYTPLYLHGTIGLPMSDILGIIIPVALIPFIVSPYILGNLADKRFGEKEILIIGFVIMGVSTFYLSFITVASVAIWAMALLITRIGATAIETMAESYFFKQVDATDTHIISFFRNLRSLSYLVAPVAASAFITAFSFQYLFACLGIIILLGLRPSLRLTDTR